LSDVPPTEKSNIEGWILSLLINIIYLEEKKPELEKKETEQKGSSIIIS
jgi:hypothetical protein